jgi:glutamate racemase
MRQCVLSIFFIAVLADAGDTITPQEALAKESVKILITDSGLGGLSVAADFEKRLQSSRQFKRAEIIFANALPGGSGYNDMKSVDEKARVFSDALFGMVQWYRPDVIVIACNTLSVVYPLTEFSRSSSVPVVGIVEIATAMFAERLKSDATSSVIIFGTETTIESGAHKEQLVSRSIDASRIVTQACPKLESEIQTDPTGDMVTTYIDWYVEEAAESLPKRGGTVYAGLCCTHYGYSQEQFAASLEHAGVRNAVIINPNNAMAEAVLPQKQKQYDTSEISVQVVSRAEISEEEISAIAALIRKDSEKTAAALEQYLLKRDLFPFSLR